MKSQLDLQIRRKILIESQIILKLCTFHKMTKLRILLATWTVFSTCLARPDVHKQMTQNQIQSIFHVEDVHSVPHYELVRLIPQGTSHHSSSSRRKRSINNQQDPSSVYASHHVKKDLSKSPYYSELKVASEQHDKNSFSDHSLSDKIKYLDLSQIKEHNVSFSAFGEVLNLTLKPTSGLFKDGPQSLRMWTARNEPNSTHGVEYDPIEEDPESQEEIGETFQDEENMAAVLMRQQLQTGDLIMEGSIGQEYVIKPLPHEFSPNQDEAHHVVYRRAADPDQFSDFALMEPDFYEDEDSNDEGAASDREHYRERRAARSSKKRKVRRGRSFRNRQRRAAPYIIYPEILVIVDYDGYRLHGGDNVQVKRYFVSFWNGVDLRYRLLKGPRIRISIAGIIISRGRDATPYLERNRVGRDAIDSAAALTDMGKYLFRERRLPVYDIAVAITKLDMCRRNYPYGDCKRGTAGFAYVGGACVVNKRLEKVNSVAIIEDTGGFSGIIVAAHEVGHLLGAVHDGSPPPSYLGGPGAEKCRWEDGYIMSDLRHTERGFRWSPCSVQSFHHFLNGDTATCLHNTPHEDHALGRSLPGTLLSLDAQCRRDRGTYACFKDDRVCAQLFCFDSGTGYCVAYRPAAEGSSCGSGSHCLDGRCVAQHSASYSHHSHAHRPSYRSDEDADLDESATNFTSTLTSGTVTTSTQSQSPYLDNSSNENSHNTDNTNVPNDNNDENINSNYNINISKDNIRISTIAPFHRKNDNNKYNLLLSLFTTTPIPNKNYVFDDPSNDLISTTLSPSIITNNNNNNNNNNSKKSHLYNVVVNENDQEHKNEEHTDNPVNSEKSSNIFSNLNKKHQFNIKRGNINNNNYNTHLNALFKEKISHNVPYRNQFFPKTSTTVSPLATTISSEQNVRKLPEKFRISTEGSIPYYDEEYSSEEQDDNTDNTSKSNEEDDNDDEDDDDDDGDDDDDNNNKNEDDNIEDEGSSEEDNGEKDKNHNKESLNPMNIISNNSRHSNITGISRSNFYNNNSNKRTNIVNRIKLAPIETPTTQRSYIFGGRSTSRSPFIDAYLKKLASTRGPLKFDNISQYARRSTQSPPPYASNILGENTNNSPVNVSVV